MHGRSMRAKLKIRGIRPENMSVVQEVQKNIENKIEESVSNLKIEIDNHAKDIRKIKEKIYKRSWIIRLINKIKDGNII
jgi:hypothetical protein